MLLCRTDRFLSKDIKSKIALFCNVEEEAVITAKDVASIYEVPVVCSSEGVDTLILRYLHLEAKDRDLKEWDELVHRIYNPQAEVKVAQYQRVDAFAGKHHRHFENGSHIFGGDYCFFFH